MRNMLKFFGELPDSHILAGLCEPERRGEHYAREGLRSDPGRQDHRAASGHQWTHLEPLSGLGIPAPVAIAVRLIPLRREAGDHDRTFLAGQGAMRYAGGDQDHRSG